MAGAEVVWFLQVKIVLMAVIKGSLKSVGAQLSLTMLVSMSDVTRWASFVHLEVFLRPSDSKHLLASNLRRKAWSKC